MNEEAKKVFDEMEREAKKALFPVRNIQPLCEGEIPPGGFVGKKEEDLEGKETDTYFIYGMEEYWGWKYVCKECRTKFMAFDTEHNQVSKFCPGCGKELE